MDPGSLQGELDRLAVLLDCSVSLDGVDGSLLGYSTQRRGADAVRIEAILSRHVPDEVLAHQRSHGIDEATGPVLVPPSPALGMDARTCLPLRSGTRLLGHVWVLHAGDRLDDGATRALTESGHRLVRLLDAGGRPDPDELVADLFDHGPAPALLELVAERASTLAGRLLCVALDPVVEVRGRRAPAPSSAAPGVPRLRTEIGRATRDGRTLLLLGQAAGVASGADVVRRLVDAADTRCTAGWAVLDDLSSASARAVLAADCAASDPALPEVCDWSALGIHAHLLRAGPAAWATSHPVGGDDPSGEMLRETLEVYLDHAGSAARATAALGIHRTTFYYRLDRLAQHGVDLDDGLARSGLHATAKGRRLHAARDRYRWSDRLLVRAGVESGTMAP